MDEIKNETKIELKETASPNAEPLVPSSKEKEQEVESEPFVEHNQLGLASLAISKSLMGLVGWHPPFNLPKAPEHSMFQPTQAMVKRLRILNQGSWFGLLMSVTALFLPYATQLNFLPLIWTALFFEMVGLASVSPSRKEPNKPVKKMVIGLLLTVILPVLFLFLSAQLAKYMPLWILRDVATGGGLFIFMLGNLAVSYAKDGLNSSIDAILGDPAKNSTLNKIYVCCQSLPTLFFFVACPLVLFFNPIAPKFNSYVTNLELVFGCMALFGLGGVSRLFLAKCNEAPTMESSADESSPLLSPITMNASEPADPKTVLRDLCKGMSIFVLIIALFIPFYITLFCELKQQSGSPLGVFLYEIGQRQLAVNAFDQTIAAHPNAGAYHMRGLAYTALGQHKRAIDDFDQALSTSPDFTTYAERGRAYGELGQYQRAVDDYNKAIRLMPTSGMVVGYRAETEHKMGRLDLEAKDNALADRLGGRVRFYFGIPFSF